MADDKGTTKRKWTVLVYLAGDNNLSAEMIFGLLEMKAAGVDPRDVAVVAQLNPKGDGLPTQRFVINGSPAGAGPVTIGASGTGRAGGYLPYTSGATRLSDDALLADVEIGKNEPRIFSDMLTLVADHRESLPILGPTVSDLSQDELKKRAKKISQLQMLSRTAAGKSLKYVKEDNDLLPAFKDASLTDDTGNPWTLLRFLFWGIDNFEAEKYLIVLSGHGSGAVGDFLRDDTSGGSLTVAGLGEVFAVLRKKVGGNVEVILGLDSCLMSMAEVYCELAGSVDFVIGAEGFEPNTGWPYRQVLEPLMEDPSILPREYAKTIVDKYAQYYFDYSLGGVSVDLSACDCKPKIVEGLTDRVANLTRSMIAMLQGSGGKREILRDAILLAHWNAQTYKFDQYTDLRDFCDLLAKRNIKGIVGHCKSIVKYIDENVVLNRCFSGPVFQYSYGLSIYFPWAACSKDYLDLKFAKTTGWGEFLKLFIEGEGLSRRPPRQECQTGNPVLAKVFSPCPDKVNSPRASSPAGVKADDPCKHASVKFTKPCDRGPGERTNSVKNPPIRWCPLCNRNLK
ncbi:MAG: clostripain-related cysteine peptidase [Blastocatellia bacterium]